MNAGSRATHMSMNGWYQGNAGHLPGRNWENDPLGQEARKYDSMEGIDRVELGTETENNAYRHGWRVVEQCIRAGSP